MSKKKELSWLPTPLIDAKDHHNLYISRFVRTFRQGHEERWELLGIDTLVVRRTSIVDDRFKHRQCARVLLLSVSWAHCIHHRSEWWQGLRDDVRRQCFPRGHECRKFPHD